MTINELRAKRAEHWESMKAFLNTHRQANGTLTVEDDATYQNMETELDAQTAAIAREERAQQTEIMLNTPSSTPLTGRPGESTGANGSETYRKAFSDGLRRGFSNALQAGTGAEGGYLVPEEFERQLLSGLDEVSGLRAICHKVNTSGTHKIPVVTTKAAAAWVAEEGDLTTGTTDPVFGQKTLEAHKLGALIRVSNELLHDAAFDLEAYIREELTRSIGEKEEDGFINGDGAGKPKGILDETNGGTLAKTAAAAAAVTSDELMDLFYALKAPYRKNARWLMKDSTVKAVRKLKGSDGQYMWTPSLMEGQPDMLLGRPLLTSDAMPAMATGNKSIVIGDFTFYWIGDRQGVEMQRLNELYAGHDQVGFKVTARVDGLLTVSEAVQYLKQA